MAQSSLLICSTAVILTLFSYWLKCIQVQQIHSLTTSPSSSLTILNTFHYPKTECLNLVPVNQFYHPFLYTLDSDYYDFCDLNGFSNNTIPSELVDFLPNFSCVDLFCSHDKVWDLMNSTQVTALGVFINHCLHCNNSQSEMFREYLLNNSCKSFSIVSEVDHFSLSSSKFIEKLNQVSYFHCNNRIVTDSDISNKTLKNFPIFNHNILGDEILHNL